MITFAILVTGFSGLIAQILLLRELLVSYLGNELTLGIILADWLIGEALGVFIIGKLIDRIRNKAAVFTILQIGFSLALPSCLYLARTYKAMIGVPAGEAVSLAFIFYSSFFIILPVAFCHAGLFSCGCKLLSSNRSGTKETPAGSIAKIYALETSGTIIGGITLTYVLLSRFDPFQIAFVVSAASLLVNLPFLNLPSAKIKILRYLNLSLAGVFIYLSISGSSAYIQNISVKRQFASAELLDYRSSPYGNITVIRKEGQLTFFYNGLPIITSPFPDVTFSEEFGNLPLLFQQDPKKVLIMGGGAGGIIYEILKYPVERIDYIELDPMVIAMLRKYPTAPIKMELSDKRVNIINTDGRVFLHNTARKYDLILIGSSDPRELSTNRFFTSDFFSLAKEKLHRAGILSFCLPGSLTYLSSELKNLNAGILNAAKENFTYVRVLPGDYNMFFASASGEIMDITAATLSSKINALNIKTNLLVPAYLDYRLNNQWSEWFYRSMAGSTKIINKDEKPFAVFEALILWNKQFSGAFTRILNYLSGLNLKMALALILVISFPIFLLTFLRRGKETTLNITYSITTTGFFGMLISLIIMFMFQVRYGCLYRDIGMLTSLFMAGSAIASILALRLLGNKDTGIAIDLLVRVEAVIIVFTIITACLTSLLGYGNFSYLALLVLSFLAGSLVGLEFPLAGKIYTTQRKEVGETSGTLYFADLIGGCLAGVLGGVLLLPVVGITNTCLVLALLKSSSLTALIFYKNTTKKTL